MTLLSIPKMMLNLKWSIQNEASTFQGFILYHNSSKNPAPMPLRNMICLFGEGKMGEKRFMMPSTTKCLDYPFTLKNQRQHHKLGGQVISGHINGALSLLL